MSNTTMSAVEGEADGGVCAGGSTFNGSLNLRIASIFVILVTSLIGSTFPILSRRIRRRKTGKSIVPEWCFLFAKYFGSGVIIGTAFIHLLAPAFTELTDSCLPAIFATYPFAPLFSLISVFFIFILELVANRTGDSYLRKRGLSSHDPHSGKRNGGLAHSGHGTHVESSRLNLGLGEGLAGKGSGLGTETPPVDVTVGQDLEGARKIGDGEAENSLSATPTTTHEEVGEGGIADHDDILLDESAVRKIVGVCILEVGVIFHSAIIGLTLAVTADFATLFVVLVFHQMFEGLGLGSRLSELEPKLPRRLRNIPLLGAVAYPFVTPIGIAVGLGIRHSYNPESVTANIVSGVLDAFSSGILLYTGLVELLAHDFIFNKDMAQEASNLRVFLSLSCVLFGAGIMALLGRWA